MQKVAVFGNAGGGKSTLAKKLAKVTGLPLYSVDTLKFRDGGDEIPHPEYLLNHEKLLARKQWIMDGFGCVPSAWQRFGAADTLVYIDLPLYLHFWWVTKRCLKGFWVSPEGWPKGSPLFKSTLRSFKACWLCHKKLTPRYRQYISANQSSKNVIYLRSKSDIDHFIASLEKASVAC